MKLKKELRLFDVYALATGATLSGGLFLLPGPAFAAAGPAMVLCYLLAALALVPAMLCIVELSTAMPRAGGAYYFLERSLGPLVGTVGGLGTWLALVLKTAFALVGLGAYVALFVEHEPWAVKLIAVCFALLFGALNLAGSKKSGTLQRYLVIGLLAVLAMFLVRGLPAIEMHAFDGFFAEGGDAILATAGMVYISYAGITKMVSVSEEVADPERNLPLGVFLSLGTAVVVYVLCTAVLVGVLPAEELAGTNTPMADGAAVIAGTVGKVLVSIAAILAFFSVANAGILASSRYPLAMSRDGLAPEVLGRVSSARGVPVPAVLLTVGVIVAVVLVLDPLKIAKLASAFQLLMFALLCGAVIVMRESRIGSYDPGYKAPFYPWVPLIGLMAPFPLIFQMGWLPTAFSGALLAAGVGWYTWYGKARTERHGAIYHVFARLGEEQNRELDRELRGILKEKGLRENDPFESIVMNAVVLDVSDVASFDDLVKLAGGALAARSGHSPDLFVKGFTEGTLKGATPVAKGVALPHMHLEDIEGPLLALVRVKSELRFLAGDVFGKTSMTEGVHAAFFLVSPGHDPAQHLRLLAQLASRIDQEDFMEHWLAAQNELALREVFLRDDRYVSVQVTKSNRAADWVGLELLELGLPEGCLVAALRRGGRTLVPRGHTRLEEGDRLLIFGEPEVIAGLRGRFEGALENGPSAAI
ncbi:MAG: amino acid permease [Planctomycetes bacterium]|nr:amino acid permease [Planctomycetota bacterium]MCB9903922.1 amino acid permease [Planctomycetota bacterium]